MTTYIIEHVKNGLTVFTDLSGKAYPSPIECTAPFKSLNDAVVYALNNLKGDYKYLPYYISSKELMEQKQTKQEPAPTQMSNTVSNCTFHSNDTYNIDVADTIKALADAVKANAEAISSICYMVKTLPHSGRPAMISFTPDTVKENGKEIKKAT